MSEETPDSKKPDDAVLAAAVAPSTENIPEDDQCTDYGVPSEAPRQPYAGHRSSSYTGYLSLGYHYTTQLACSNVDFEVVALKNCNQQQLTPKRLLLMACRHDNIIPIREWWLHEDTLHVVQECVGVTLDHISSWQLTFEERQIQEICSSVHDSEVNITD